MADDSSKQSESVDKPAIMTGGRVSRKRTIVLIVAGAILVAIAVAGYWFVLREPEQSTQSPSTAFESKFAQLEDEQLQQQLEAFTAELEQTNAKLAAATSFEQLRQIYDDEYKADDDTAPGLSAAAALPINRLIAEQQYQAGLTLANQAVAELAGQEISADLYSARFVAALKADDSNQAQYRQQAIDRLVEVGSLASGEQVDDAYFTGELDE